MVLLARDEGLAPGGRRTQLMELAALLHDVQDWKYSRDEDATARAVQVGAVSVHLGCRPCRRDVAVAVGVHLLAGWV